MTLPILDLRRLDGTSDVRAGFLAALRRAAREQGFFYLTGHGISPALIGEVQALSRRFFGLPDGEKSAIEMINSPHFRGYTRLGWERTRGRPDWREQLDVGAERAAIASGPGVPAWARLQGPNQWPASLPELRPVLLRYQADMTALLGRLLKAFACALEQPEDVFEPIYRDGANQLIKIIRYPGLGATAEGQGVGAHKDSGLLTAVLQDEHGGLQIETDGGWLDAEPIPGTFVVNIGELLELASDGYLRATVHRVVPPPPGAERYSVAFFLGARLDTSIPHLALPPHLAAQALGPDSDPRNPLFRQTGLNYLKGRLRSHPDVARRHHGDLLEQFGIAPTEPA